MTFNNKTIEDLHNLLVSKEISATELTQATLEDIKARETAINAFVTIAEEQALSQAKAIDEAGIDADNVLSGIPLAVKDNISTDGILTTAAFATTLSKIVDMVELLGEVDTTGVAPTTTMADRKTVLRPDVAEEGTDRDRLFKNVPEKDNYYIKVPAILDDGGDA